MHTLALAVFLTAAPTPDANGAHTNGVPDALRSWIPWALRDHPEARCPFFLGKTDRGCLWPSRLGLQLDERGGHFSQEWTVYVDQEGFAELPGDAKHWPLDVTVDGKPAPVIEHSGDHGSGPAVVLTHGPHTVAGRFAWDSLPESLRLPSGVGLLGRA